MVEAYGQIRGDTLARLTTWASSANTIQMANGGGVWSDSWGYSCEAYNMGEFCQHNSDGQWWRRMVRFVGILLRGLQHGRVLPTQFRWPMVEAYGQIRGDTLARLTTWASS